MPTFLFGEIIFGPVNSRRLGCSLGINLLPVDRKLCSFDCLYCECGLNPDVGAPKAELPTVDEITKYLELKLQEMSGSGRLPDVLTFAGNGEPTLHPDFPEIIDSTCVLRDKYCPSAKIAVLSNGSRIGSPRVFNALLKVDDNILKLDAGSENTIKLLDRPSGKFNLQSYVENVKRFDGKVIIQSLFIKGHYNGELIDNSSDHEVAEWLKLIKYIAPGEVMVYSIARDTPVDTLQKVEGKRLKEIASLVEKEGIKVQLTE